jgi:chitinase
MKHLLFLLGLALIFATGACDIIDNESGVPKNIDIWVNAHLNAAQHNPETPAVNTGTIRNQDIDWSAITHLTYHTLQVDSTGQPLGAITNLDSVVFNQDRINSIVQAAHTNNTQILFSVGSESNYTQFRLALADTTRDQLIATVLDILRTYEFDGINLNMIPLTTTDYNNYSDFVFDLRKTLNSMRTARNQTPLLTATTMRTRNMIQLHTNLQANFDQINIRTFGLTQPWRGWKAWHHAPLYNKNEVVFDSTIVIPYPSVDSKVSDAIESGMDRRKMGLGINFNGYVWDYVHYKEIWPTWPTEDLSILHTVPYAQINAEYDMDQVIWDNKAKVPYLNMTGPKAFATFENEQSVQAKVEYAKEMRLGGIMIWELSAAYLANQSSNPKDPLLKAIKSSAFQVDPNN